MPPFNGMPLLFRNSCLLFGFLLFDFARLSFAYAIEGSIAVPVDAPPDWFVHTRVHVDGSQHVGFVRRDGTFEVSDVPSGSYVVEPIHTSYQFQTARVDITSKGKIRARRVNAPQPNAVKEMAYPLRLMSMGKSVYFKPREQMRTIDLLLNPSVLYVLVPFLLVMVLTKLVNTNDPELQKELQQMNIQNQLPDVGELFSSMSLFGGGANPTGGRKKIGGTSNGPGRRQTTALGASGEPRASGSTGASSSGVEYSTVAANRKEKKRRTQQ